jgi:hypothetical protein
VTAPSSHESRLIPDGKDIRFRSIISLCTAPYGRPGGFDGTLAFMHTLTQAELDHLWECLTDHVPGSREDFRDTLRDMVAISAATVRVTPDRVEVQMPLMYVAFNRGRRSLAPNLSSRVMPSDSARWEFTCARAGACTWQSGKGSVTGPFSTLEAATVNARTHGFDPFVHHWTDTEDGRTTHFRLGKMPVTLPAGVAPAD